MTQHYTPVTWQDETTSQQGTLINAERLNQMQTAHHYADGFEEVDKVPTANPSVAYHKIVYCTADSTFYRWDGTEWTADIDDETKRLLEQEIARATAAEGGLAQSIEDETSARETADTAMQADISALGDAIEAEETARGQADTALGTRITNETTARETADTALGNRITAEATARAEADTLLGGRIDTEQARAEAAEQANAQAIANTYTKAEIDTALGAKADVATTYTKTETDALLALKANQATTYTKTEVQTYVSNALDGYLPMVRTTGNQTIYGVKTFNDGVDAYPQGWHNLYEGGEVAQGSYTKIATINNPSNIGYNAIIEFMAGGNNGLEYGRLAISGANSQAADSGTFAWIERTTGIQWNKILFDEDCVVIATKSDGTRDILVYKRDLYGGVVYRTVMENSYGILLSKSNTCIEYVTPVAVNLADYASTYTPKLGSIEGLDYATLMDAQATQNALDGYLPMVRTTGNQTLTATKTWALPYGDYAIKIKGTTSDIGAGVYQGSIPHLAFFDKNDVQLADLRCFIQADGRATVNLTVRNADGTSKSILLGDGNQ